MRPTRHCLSGLAEDSGLLSWVDKNGDGRLQYRGGSDGPRQADLHRREALVSG